MAVKQKQLVKNTCMFSLQWGNHIIIRVCIKVQHVLCCTDVFCGKSNEIHCTNLPTPLNANNKWEPSIPQVNTRCG